MSEKHKDREKDRAIQRERKKGEGGRTKGKTGKNKTERAGHGWR